MTSEAADGRAVVLVVDDDPAMQSLLAKVLEKEGYRVISAAAVRRRSFWRASTNRRR